MPYSMTGFGAAQGAVGAGQLRVEIRTVNHRFFNPSLKLPAELGHLEGDLRDRLRREFERGHVAVAARWTGPAQVGGGLRLDLDRAREAMARLRELQTAVGLSGEVPLDLLAGQSGVLSVAPEEEQQIPWEEVEPLVADAAADCRAMRRREGAALTEELRLRLDALEALGERIAVRAPERVAEQRDRLRSAVAELLDGRPMDEARMAQEVALLADRLDIREELVRFRAHLAAAREALGSNGSVGKQLGFLAQELGREVNTTGAKANDAAIAQWVIAMKGELERFREQVENLE